MFDKLIIALISPLGTTLLLGALAAVLALLRRPRLPWWLGVGALLWLYLWALPAPSLWLRQQVEGAYPPVPLAEVPQAEVIVVLGGAISATTDPRDYPNLAAAADRIWHAARLYHAGKAPTILLSGGSATEVGFVPEAVAMQMFLRDLGVPNSAVVLEGRSQNTRENARLTAELLKSSTRRRMLLVTSALHMRRAKVLFDAVGLEVIPAATDHEAKGRQHWRLLPQAIHLDGSGRAMKELVGSWSGR